MSEDVVSASEGDRPTWVEVLECGDLGLANRRWIVARYLSRDRRLLVSWAADCAELLAPRAGKWEADVRATIAELRRWCAGEAVDLAAVRDRALEIRRDAAAAADAAYPAAASATSAAADAADYAYAYVCLRLSLPYLAAVAEVTWTP